MNVINSEEICVVFKLLLLLLLLLMLMLEMCSSFYYYYWSPSSYLNMLAMNCKKIMLGANKNAHAFDAAAEARRGGRGGGGGEEDDILLNKRGGRVICREGLEQMASRCGHCWLVTPEFCYIRKNLSR